MREYKETTENTQEERNMETEEQPQMEQNGANGTDDESDVWHMLDDMMAPPTRGHPGGRGCPMGPRGRPFTGRGGGRGRGFGMGPPWARMPMGPRGPHGMGFYGKSGPGWNLQGPGCGFGIGPRWSGYQQYAGQMVGPMGFWNHPHAAYSAPFAQAWNQGPPHFLPGAWAGPQGHTAPGVPPRLLRRIKRLAAQMEEGSSSSDSEMESPGRKKAGDCKIKKDERADQDKHHAAGRKSNMRCRKKGKRDPMAMGPGSMYLGPGPMGMGPGQMGMGPGPVGMGIGPMGIRPDPRGGIGMTGPLGWGGRPHGPPRHGVPPHLLQRLRRLVAVMEQEEQQDSKDGKADNQGDGGDHSQGSRPARRQVLLQRLKACLERATDHEAPCSRPGRRKCCGPNRPARCGPRGDDDSSSSESDADVTKAKEATKEQTGPEPDKKPGVDTTQKDNAPKKCRHENRKAGMEQLMTGMQEWSGPMGMCHGPPHMGPGPMGMGPDPRGEMGMGWFGQPHGPPMQGRPVIPRPLLQRLRRLVKAMENEGQQAHKDKNNKTDTTQNDESLQRLLESLGSDTEGDIPSPRHCRHMEKQGHPGPGPHLPLRRLLKQLVKAQERDDSSKPHTYDGPNRSATSNHEEDPMQADTEPKDDWIDLCKEVQTLDITPEAPEQHPCPTCNCSKTA